MKNVKTLLIIASSGLIVAGMIFLILAIFVDKSTWVLASALGSISLSNLFNIILMQLKRKKSD